MSDFILTDTSSVLKYDGISVTSFSNTPGIGSADATNNSISGPNVAVSQTGNFFIIPNGVNIQPYLLRYDPIKDEIYKIDLPNSAGKTFISHLSAIITNKDRIVFFAKFNSHTWVSDDNGETWEYITVPSAQTNVSDIGHVQFIDGQYYNGPAFNNNLRLLVLDAGLSGWVDTGLHVIGGGYTASMLTPFNGNLYILTNQGSLSTAYLYRINGSTATLISSFNPEGNYIYLSGLISDAVNGRLVVFVIYNTNNKYAYWTDTSVSTFTQDNTIIDGISGVGSLKNQVFQDFSGLTTNPLFLRTYQSTTKASDILEYDTTTMKLSDKISASQGCSITFYNYGGGVAFAGVKDAGMNTGGNRYQFDIRVSDKNSSPVSITPQFSLNQGYTFSNMTVDENTSNLSVNLPPITIGSETNSFNDDFSADRLSTHEGYEINSKGATSSAIVDTATSVLKISVGTGESLSVLRRFLLLTGDFELKIGFNGLGTNLLSGTDTVKAGLRVRVLGDSSTNKFFSDTNYAEIYALKDAANAGLYQENQVVAGTSTITSGVASPSSGEDPAFHIRRISGVISTGYGSVVTWLSSASPLSYSAEMLLEIFVEAVGSASQIVEFKNLHLVSGNYKFFGHIANRFNWNFVLDGISSDTVALVKVIGSA